MTQRKFNPRSASSSVQNGVPFESDHDRENLFHGLNLPVLFLGNDLRLLGFTTQAAEMFLLEGSAAGSRISKLNLKVPGLAKLAAQVLRTRNFSETEVQCQNGHWYLLRIEPRLNLDRVPGGGGDLVYQH